MKFNNAQISSAILCINQMLTIKLPFAARLTLSKNKKNLMEVFDVYNETRSEIINEYAKKDEEGNFVDKDGGKSTDGQFVVEKDKDEFIKKMNDLAAEESDIEVEPIKVTKEIEKKLDNLDEGVDFSEALWLFK